MERDANFLRCSKLSCYGEFNRMVQAIARSGGGAVIQGVPGTKPVHGTSSEYFFYTTLVSMLSHVISNANPAAQKTELQQVYEWFCVNKPLISTKTGCRHRKPVLSMTKQPPKLLDRPQTAPASLCTSSLHPPSFLSSLSTSSCRPGSIAMHRRPQTTHPHHGFASSYMSQSLALGWEQLEQPPTTPHGGHLPVSASSSTRQSGLKGTPERSVEMSAGSRSNIQQPALFVVATPREEQFTPSVVTIPSSGQQFVPSIVAISGSGQQLSSEAHPASLTMTTVCQLVPSVAAQMELVREMKTSHGSRPAQHPPPRSSRKSVRETVSSCSAEENQDDHQTLSGSPTIILHPPPPPLPPSQPLQEATEQPLATTATAHCRQITPSLPTVYITTHTPSPTTHTSHSYSRREQQPVHRLILSLSPSTLHPPQPTQRRPAPSQLRRSAVVAAAGFKCSRYSGSSTARPRKQHNMHT